MESVEGAAAHELSIHDLQGQVARFSKVRHWDRQHSLGELSKAIVVEAAELLELTLWSPDGSLRGSDEDMRSEMADILIYLLNLAEMAEVDVAQAVLDKLEVNATRFPTPEAESPPSSMT